MSNVNSTSIDDMMKAIRKNTYPSKCIDTFESLIREIGDDANVFITNMNQFIEEFSHLSVEIDRMKNLRYQARLLTYDFLNPKKFFHESKKAVTIYAYGNAGIFILRPEFLTTFENPFFDINHKNILGHITYDQEKDALREADAKTKGLLTKAFHDMDIDINNDEDVQKFHEHCRKIALLWNYLPSIVKAMIQTKRRKLGLDNNSKKFPTSI